MTIPKNLQEKRDELAELHHDKTNTRLGHYKKGFNAACNLLLPEIEKLQEALKHYNQWSRSEFPTKDEIERDVDCGCCSHGATGAVAHQALQSLREFLGEESGGKNV